MIFYVQNSQVLHFFTNLLFHQRTTPNKIIDIYAKAVTDFPIYQIDGNFIDSPEYDSNGILRLDLYQKLIQGHVNFTSGLLKKTIKDLLKILKFGFFRPDGSQNLKIQGNIPDTRSAGFYIWRNYEDIHISDVSYYIQMNHSRLISSKLLWRPTIRKEVKEEIKNFMSSRYNSFGGNF